MLSSSAFSSSAAVGAACRVSVAGTGLVGASVASNAPGMAWERLDNGSPAALAANIAQATLAIVDRIVINPAAPAQGDTTQSDDHDMDSVDQVDDDISDDLGDADDNEDSTVAYEDGVDDEDEDNMAVKGHDDDSQGQGQSPSYTPRFDISAPAWRLFLTLPTLNNNSLVSCRSSTSRPRVAAMAPGALSIDGEYSKEEVTLPLPSMRLPGGSCGRGGQTRG
ncbi:hypothetical protein SPBR_03244 [Sporothrix brasiliensis 5110]|uniref:Uncharacterized protein n=1 Tax=Sporothrix brasiliensis 5110 TaxID=1398154 RepID=A0A0C2J4U6_9PEZI|nr:uncharacterized protein SPBR_03244 [Sporothrix brasiliensis 5110]KIH92092.1 hypothetical protein SPBR_03244 [Sporothrix brasiliensis 5110]